MSSIGMAPSTFFSIGLSAPRNRRSEDPDDPLNAVVSLLTALNASISRGFLVPAQTASPLASPYAAESTAIIIKMMPYLLAWVAYFIHHIIIPGREEEFTHDVAEISADLIANFAGARVHPSVYEEVSAFGAPRSSGKTFFLSFAIPALLFHSRSLSADTRRQVLFGCYRAIGFLIGKYMDPVPLTPNGQELYDALRTQPERFADLFQTCIVDAVGSLRSELLDADDFKTVIHFLSISYRGIYRFVNEERVICRLLASGYVRWTCEMMNTLCRSKLLHQTLKAADADPEEKRVLLVLSDGCIQTGYNHLGRLILRFGIAIVQQAYNEHAVFSVLRMHHLVVQHPKMMDSVTLEVSIHGIGEFFTFIAPYLVYHSVLKLAIRTQSRARRFLAPEIAGTIAWKSFEHQLNAMTELYKLDRRHRSTVCDSHQCPNTTTRDEDPHPRAHPLRVCSGCGLSYYCSVSCQRQDWRQGHRDKCHADEERLRTTGVRQAISSRDRFFLHYVTREVMYPYRHKDHSLVRDLDLTVVPPQVKLRPLRSYNSKDFNQNLLMNMSSRESQSIPVVFLLPMGIAPVKKSGRWDVDLANEKGGISFTCLNDSKMIPMFES
ncbi:hypothetical protein BDZ89DRAFT_826810 [Hymenopellis radicata]|nr:hypothetical protein BDZ89DRAFT_826810 [Hymenopellis radicata]